MTFGPTRVDTTAALLLLALRKIQHPNHHFTIPESSSNGKLPDPPRTLPKSNVLLLVVVVHQQYSTLLELLLLLYNYINRAVPTFDLLLLLLSLSISKSYLLNTPSIFSNKNTHTNQTLSNI